MFCPSSDLFIYDDNNNNNNNNKSGGRGLRSVETTYKDIKIKAAMKLYHNSDPFMEAVRLFEEKSVRGGRHSIIKDASRYAEELGFHLRLEYLEPMCITDDGKEVNGKKVKGCIAKAHQEEVRATVLCKSNESEFRRISSKFGEK